MSEVSKYPYIRKKIIKYEKTLIINPELFGRLIAASSPFVEHLAAHQYPLSEHVDDICRVVYDSQVNEKRRKYLKNLVHRKRKFLVKFIKSHQIETETRLSFKFQRYEEIGRAAQLEIDAFYEDGQDQDRETTTRNDEENVDEQELENIGDNRIVNTNRAEENHEHEDNGNGSNTPNEKERESEIVDRNERKDEGNEIDIQHEIGNMERIQDDDGTLDLLRELEYAIGGINEEHGFEKTGRHEWEQEKREKGETHSATKEMSESEKKMINGDQKEDGEVVGIKCIDGDRERVKTIKRKRKRRNQLELLTEGQKDYKYKTPYSNA